MLKKRFTKEDIYELSRGTTGPWQEKWLYALGESVVVTLSDKGYANVIVLSEGQETLPQTMYVKRGGDFLKLDEEVFERVRGEGNFVGKVRLPVSLQVEISEGEGVVGSIHQRKVVTCQTGYTKRVERVEWVTNSAKFRIVFNLQWIHVYGSEWEQVFQRVEEIKKERERSRLIEVGRKWCTERGLKVKHEEVYLLVGESILEELEERKVIEEKSFERFIWGSVGGEEIDDVFDDLAYFYVGPDTAELKLKRGSFVYGMLELLFTGSPKVLLSYLSLD